MPSRYWLRAFAAIGLAALAVIGWRLYEWHENRERAYQAAKQEYDDTKRVLPPGVVFEGQRTIANPQAYREEWRDERDLDAQRDMADWAFLMILVSAFGAAATSIGVVYVAFTLKQTRAGVQAAQDAVAVTREIGQAEIRAYISLSHDEPGLDFNSKPGRAILNVVVVNDGQTPGTVVKTRFGLVDSPNLEALPDTPPSEGVAEFGNGSSVVGPKAAHRFPVEFLLPHKGGHVIVFGSVEYVDVFKRCYVRGYARRFAPHPARPNNNLVIFDKPGWEYDDTPCRPGEGSDT